MTYDIVFNKSEDIADYLTMKCPQFHNNHLLSEVTVKSQATQNDSMVFTDTMKQHLLIFRTTEPVFCKEYPCSWKCSLQFNFKECLGEDVPLYADVSCNDKYCDDERDGDVLNKSE